MNVGFWEIAGLAVLALLIFGPQRLPEVARQVGKTVTAFRREANATLGELRSAAEVEEFKEFGKVASELRSTTAELKQAARLTGPMASPAKATTRGSGGAVATVRADLPAPFDPDAT